MAHRSFNREPDFENALIAALGNKGWGDMPILKYPTEEQLIQNWADILFKNNNHIDSLNGYPLTEGEMEQILSQVALQRTPLNLNKFVNGRSVTIIRDNPDDTVHLGQPVPLSIYDRKEIAGGRSIYQIARQPKFTTSSRLLGDRRGDFMLLINGMPLIHVELKKSGIPVMNACNQIERYMHEGVFSGIFSLVQVFVAMTPEETLYFANPGPDGVFNKTYYFHWADFNNEIIDEWEEIAETLLSIPMAHQLIGFYTVPDEGDKILKVMRSYQYYAAHKISETVKHHNWKVSNPRGGYIWHTTGSGKTLTSFKSAQLIAQSNLPDLKVVFLVDRIELGTQSFDEYKGFAGDDTVNDTKNTKALIGKLKSSEVDETLIVTSIQKMSNINEEAMRENMSDLEEIRKKKIVFIVDEAHRSVFGDTMFPTILKTFPLALFFGFTGTPIFEDNQRKMNWTATLFGDELHHYLMSDGIRDKNVTGFNPVQVSTYRDRDLRKVIALEKAKAQTEAEAFADERKKEIYLHYMNEVPMAGVKQSDGSFSKGIEDYFGPEQYDRDEHREGVVDDILENFPILSLGGKYHAILATSSIPEAIKYYRLIRSKNPDLKVACLFDPTIDEGGSGIEKEEAILEIIDGYNERYHTDYTQPTFAKLKTDLSNRLAHKKAYKDIASEPERQIDLLIVVDQMLTGFDSKWINTLYLDKELRYEGLIQAFSRTNRPHGNDKPFGTIRYYRKVHTMKRNIDEAIAMYAGDRPFGVFVDKLPYNLRKINETFAEIKELFEQADISDFSKLPDNDAEKGRFAKLFKTLHEYIQAARLQGFNWGVSQYQSGDGEVIDLAITEEDFNTLIARYKELYSGTGGGTGGGNVPYDIDIHLTEAETGKIDYDYMNSRFEKYLKELRSVNVDEERLGKVLDELHKSYATLSQEEQHYADSFLHDVQTGDAELNVCKSFHDYIIDYKNRAQAGKIHKIVTYLGVDGELLKELCDAHLTDVTINEYGRYDLLKSGVNKLTAKVYFEAKEGTRLIPPKVNMKIDALLRRFILTGEIE